MAFVNPEKNPEVENCSTVTMTAGKDRILEEHHLKRSSKKRNNRKHSAISNPFEHMEPEIWKEFPEDLIEAVLARIPVSTFFQFRSVCHKWNSLPRSCSFSVHCAQVPQSQPWFYTIPHENLKTGAIYDPSMKKWRHPTITPLPLNDILLPVASAGGLVCFLDIDQRYFICNPLTQAWKELPATSVKVESHVAVGMIKKGNSTSGGYKVIWFSCDGEYEIYDSLKNSWGRQGNVPSSIKLPLRLNFRSHTVSIGSTIYFMCLEPEGIVSYNMVSGVWKQYLIPTPPNLTDYILAGAGDRIFLVGSTKNAAICVCIWELQKMTLLWEEVDRVPNEWCLEFYGKHIHMTCLGNKGLLMLSLWSGLIKQIVTYDVAKREWLKVHGCVLPRGKKRQLLVCGTAFYPRITAVP